MTAVAAKTGASFARGSSKQDYSTPGVFLAAVRERFGINRFAFDLAATVENAVAEHFFGDPDRSHVSIRCDALDALAQDWRKLYWRRRMIIAVSGRAGVGKDTAADILVERFGFVKIALADEMKRICKRVFDFSDEQLFGASEKRNAPDERYPNGWDDSGRPMGVAGDSRTFLTPRYALQTLGTEWGRGCYENVWVDYALRIAKTIVEQKVPWSPRSIGSRGMWYGYSSKVGLENHWDKPTKGVVIPDVRFPNEVEAIRAAGGRVWRITRGKEASTEAWRQHASETSLDDWPDEKFDRTFVNDDSLASFRARVLACCIHALHLEPIE